MNRRIPLGRWGGLPVTISPLSAAMLIAMGLLIALISIPLAGLDAGAAVVAGLVVAIGFFLSEWLHQWGHAVAARRTGYPMQGIHFFSLFAISLYPPDEPALPPSTHMRRALGGFWINLLIGLLLGAAALNLGPTAGAVGWTTTVIAFWNFVVLGLGALLPINLPGILVTDGASLLHNWRVLQSQQAK